MWQFAATTTAFGEAAADLAMLLEARGTSSQRRHNLELVFEEIVVNIIRHGGVDGPDAITVSFDSSEAGAILIFEDRGAPFDSSTAPIAPRAESLEEASIGGYGLLLVRSVAARIDYVRTPDGRNRLTVVVA